MSSSIRHLRRAAGTLRRNPRFTLPAVFSFALGLGAALPLVALVRGRWPDPVPAAGDGFAWSPGARGGEALQAQGLGTLLGMVGGVALLLLALLLVNLALLLLSRAAVRRRDMALRAALGASPRRLAGELSAEGALLGGAGVAVGAGLGWAGMLLLRATRPDAVPPWLPAASAPVLCVAAIPLLLTMAVALWPARLAKRTDLHRWVGAGQRATAGPGEGALRRLLGIAAVAGSLVLLTSAGLLVRGSRAHIPDAASGMEAPRLLTLQLAPVGQRFADVGERAAFYREVLAHIDRVPGVVDSSAATPGAWVGLGTQDRVRVACGICYRGGMLIPVTQGAARHHAVSPGFFRSLGVPLIRGREISDGDRTGATPVAVINRTFAYQLFLGTDPLGKRFQVGGLNGAWYTVVGVAPDLRARGLGSGGEPVPALYLSAFQHPPHTAEIAVRTLGDPLRFAAAVEGAIREVDSRQTPTAAVTMTERLRRFRAPMRWFGGIFGVAAMAAALLSVVGLGGIVSFNVAQRTREIGVRMALGAEPRQVIGLVLREGLRLTAFGIGVGLIGAFSLARLLHLGFRGVDPLDPVVYGGAALLLAAVALAASWIPARRAARVDPMVALQAE